MAGVTIIKPKDDFSFIRRARRGLPERDQLLKNFTNVSSLNDGNVLYYKLFRSPSDDPPEGRGPEDTVEDLGADQLEYRVRVNAIATDVVNMSRQSLRTLPTEPTATTTGEEPAATTTGEEPTAAAEGEPTATRAGEGHTATRGFSAETRKEWAQYLNVMYIAFGS